MPAVARSARYWKEEPCLGLFRFAQVLISFIAPVGARRIEDVEVNGIFHRLGLVRHVRRNAENLACMHYDFFAVNPKLKRAVENVGQLLVVVAMLGNDASLLQEHT